MRSTKRSKANLKGASEGEVLWKAAPILRKSLVPVKAFQPDCLFKIYSAWYRNEMIRNEMLSGLGKDRKERVQENDNDGSTYICDMHLFGGTMTYASSIACIMENQTRVYVSRSRTSW